MSTTKTLHLIPGVANATILAERGLPELLQASFTAQDPRVEESALGVTIDYGRFNPVHWRRKSSRLVVDAGERWAVDIGRGAARLDADLAALARGGVSSIRVAGGASRVSLALPEPEGAVRIEIAGGVSKLKIVRPPSAPVMLRIAGGASTLRLDEQVFGSVGGGIQTHSSGYDAESDFYEVVISGGASSVSIVGSTQEALVSGNRRDSRGE